MPLYEYRCLKCDQTFEIIQKYSDEPLTTHNGCGGEVKKLISSPAFHLKGSGWYATDYAKSSAPKPEKSESKGEDKGDKPAAPATTPDTKTESKKIESKPASTTESKS